MITFKCPSCKTALQADEAYAGRMIECPDCKSAAQIPPAAAPPSEPEIVVPEAVATPVEAKPAPAAEAITAEPVVLAVLVAPAPSTAVTTPEHVGQAKPPAAGDEPRRRDREPTTAAAKGMGAGMTALLIVGVVGCVGLGVVAILIALLVPAVQKVRQAAARTQTMNNMKQIGIACFNYHDTYKTFPSPKMQSWQAVGDGPLPRPVDLSWRVAILPYVEQGPMFQGFDMNAGWDDKNNQQFLHMRPIVYDSVWRPTPDMTETPFQYFTGPKTPFPDLHQPAKIADFFDGTANTFLFAEAQTPVPWTKPADMVVAPNGPLPLPPVEFMAAMADGSVRLIDRRRANDAVLRMLIDPRDGQVIPPGVVD